MSENGSILQEIQCLLPRKKDFLFPKNCFEHLRGKKSRYTFIRLTIQRLILKISGKGENQMELLISMS